MRASSAEGGATAEQSVGIALEQTAVDAVSLTRTMEQEVENPRGLVLGSRVLQSLIPHIAFGDLKGNSGGRKLNLDRRRRAARHPVRLFR
jgi:hypothetical protein